jgi:nitroimidazol reductase NimA-like FMN-containing flavoprotein (pyridoxamine 5'-phosphate oxidase superfamily)
MTRRLQMLRSDREITDEKSIEAFIAKEHIIRIAFYDNGEIYIVPVNYGYTNDSGQYVFYFHGAKAGRKYELSKGSPNIGFEIDGNYELLEADIACDFSAKFQSVVGTGKISIVEDREEKLKGLNFLMRQTSGNVEWQYSEEMMNAVAVYKVDVNKISCKAK